MWTNFQTLEYWNLLFFLANELNTVTRERVQYIITIKNVVAAKISSLLSPPQKGVQYGPIK
jgi:hypothetical protein